MQNKSLYLEHFQLRNNPFRQEPDPEIFFPGANRAAILDHLLVDIQDGEPLIKLTGTAGVGKTLLYLMLAQQLPQDRYDLVCIDHPAGSFEDMLRVLCRALRGKAEDVTDPPQSYLPEFIELLKKRTGEQRKVILLIDEAEKLFLATLERLVRVMCDPDGDRAMQIVLFGRPELERNVDQLVVYCSNIDVHAGYSLEPLTFAETETYLQYRLQKSGTLGDKHRSIFSAEAVAAIFQSAMGNVRLTNMLAEKGLRDACGAGMFHVESILLDPKRQQSPGFLSRLRAGVGEAKRYRSWILGVLAVILISIPVFMWFGHEEEKAGEPPPPQVVQDIPSVKPPVEKKEVAPTLPEQKPAPVIAQEGPARDIQKKEEVVVEKTQKTEEAAVQPEKEAAEVLPVQQPAEEESSSQIVIQPMAKKKKASELVPEKQVESPGQERNGELLFEERLRATSSWLAWAYRGGYTIQLMVLTSDAAEDNLKKLLVEDDYYAIRDNLYILRKTSAQSLLVFYGLYDTMDEARQVRDNLPQFLRSHQPYALPIDEALKKTEQ